MKSFRLATLVRMLLALLFFGSALSLASDAQARAGGGSRGRSYRSAPSNNRQPQSPPSTPNAPAQRRGGFMSGLAGGIAGGFLGSMLFSSLGFAGNGAAGGGGVGFLEIILIAALAYFAFRWWKNRQLQTAAAGAGAGSSSPFSMNRQATPGQGPYAPSGAASLMPTARIPEDEASDIFFKIQGAWTRRDLSPVRNLLGPEIYADFERDIDKLKSEGRINRLENIAVRKVTVSDSWSDGDDDLVRVRFTANILDYVVDDKSGEVVQGNAHEPVKFEEDWIFAKHRNSVNWQLVGVDQV